MVEKPHIKAAGLHWNSIVGLFDYNIGGGMLECSSQDGHFGVGRTPDEAYFQWVDNTTRRENWRIDFDKKLRRDRQAASCVLAGVIALCCLLWWVL